MDFEFKIERPSRPNSDSSCQHEAHSETAAPPGSDTFESKEPQPEALQTWGETDPRTQLSRTGARHVQQATNTCELAQSLLPITNPSHFSPGGQPIFVPAFIDVLQARYYFKLSTSQLNESQKPNICTGWVAAASRICDQNEILAESLLALSSLVVGSDLQDARIVKDSLARYDRTIQRLRTVLLPEPSSCILAWSSDAVLFSCMACAIFEVDLIRISPKPLAHFLDCVDPMLPAFCKQVFGQLRTTHQWAWHFASAKGRRELSFREHPEFPLRV